MYPTEVPAGKYFSEFPTTDSLQEFLTAFKHVVREYDLPYESDEEMEKSFTYLGSKSLYLLNGYFMRKRMFSQAITFY